MSKTSNEYKRTLYNSIIYVSANVLTLVAIIVAMFQSFNYPAEALYVFCMWFFGIAVAAWGIARFLLRRVRLKLADDDESLVLLPGQKKAVLMRWKVCSRSINVERPQLQAQ